MKAIHVPTQEDLEVLLSHIKKKGLLVGPDAYCMRDKYKEDTCVSFNADDESISFTSRKTYESANYAIISLADYLEAERGCPECKGTGWYIGLFKRERCSLCCKKVANE